MEPAAHKSIRFMGMDILFALLAGAATYRLFYAGVSNSNDFHVYWKAAHTWLAGGQPYAFTAADEGFVFKYPPWILPIFFPFGLFSWEAARAIWFLVQLSCVSYSVRWTVHHGVSRRVATFALLFFWWLLHGHFSAGQFTLPLLAIALWALPFEQKHSNPKQDFRQGVLAYFLSAKVFSLFTLLGSWKSFLRLQPWLTVAGLFTAAHLLLLGISWHAGVLELTPSGIAASLSAYYQGFFAAATSGGAELGAIIVRGQGNHGFTALLLRTLKVNSMSFFSDVATSSFLAAVFGLLWHHHSKPLPQAERWSGWIALGVIVHPLAWHHSFVMIYPLCAFALSRAIQSRRRNLILLAVIGTCCIGVFVPQVIGTTLVKPLELAGMKSWGVVLAATALILSRRASFKEEVSA